MGKVTFAKAAIFVFAMSVHTTEVTFAAENCCTPDATAKIAARAGFVDIAGIKLGMPAKDAMAALKTHNAKLQTHTSSPMTFDLLPNVRFVESGGAQYSSGNGESEAISLHFTMTPNPQTVWRILRAVNYEGDGRPAAANVIAALRQKYGPEDGSMNSPQVVKSFGVELIDAYWVFDANGKKVTSQQAKMFMQNCGPNQVGDETQDVMRLQLPPKPDYWVRRGTDCGDITLVVANWQPTSPGGMQGPAGLVLRLQVEAVSHPLHRSAFIATERMVRQAEENQTNKEQQKGKQVKPVL
jgi:hypothetical protein